MRRWAGNWLVSQGLGEELGVPVVQPDLAGAGSAQTAILVLGLAAVLAGGLRTARLRDLAHRTRLRNRDLLAVRSERVLRRHVLVVADRPRVLVAGDAVFALLARGRDLLAIGVLLHGGRTLRDRDDLRGGLRRRNEGDGRLDHHGLRIEAERLTQSGVKRLLVRIGTVPDGDTAGSDDFADTHGFSP